MCVRHEDGGFVEVSKSNLTYSCILPCGREKMGLSCAIVMFVFPEATWGLCYCEPLPPSWEVVVVSTDFSLLKKVTSQRLPELKGSGVLLNGKEESSWCVCSSGCSVLLFFGLDLRIDGMSLSGEGSKTWTGYRISKACSLSNCTLSHADRSSNTEERSTYPPFRQAFKLPKAPVTCENVYVWERTEGRHRLSADFISIALPKSLTSGCKALNCWFLDYLPSALPVCVGPDPEQTVHFVFPDTLIVHSSVKSLHLDLKLFFPFLARSSLEWLLSEQK